MSRQRGDGYDDVRRYESAVVAHGRRDGVPPSVAIQPRDLELIDAVRRYKFLTTPQLVELFWSGVSMQAARMRLVALFRAGFLDRFRPLAGRGSFPWTYQLGPEGHRLLRRVGILPPRRRFEPREVFDYRYVLHEVHVNSWVLAWRRRLGGRFLSWEGEVQIEPPDDLAKSGVRYRDDHAWVEGLKEIWPKAVRPDAIVEFATKDGAGVHTMLVEYDRTQRVDKNYEKFRRYDSFLCWWGRQAMVLDRMPWVVFVCQEGRDRDRFLVAADRDLVGYATVDYAPPDEHSFVGRRRALFTTATEMYKEDQVVGERVPPLPQRRGGGGEDRRRDPVEIPTEPR